MNICWNLVYFAHESTAYIGSHQRDLRKQK
jgi:hypothetical protein